MAYLNQNGQKVVGLQHINGKLYYFEGNGVQAKGKLLTYRGKKYYFDANSGEAVTNRFIQISRGVWYYFNASGQAVTGEQVINGQHLYFDASAVRSKAVTSGLKANVVTMTPILELGSENDN